jgi:hypothetical protein
VRGGAHGSRRCVRRTGHWGVHVAARQSSCRAAYSVAAPRRSSCSSWLRVAPSDAACDGVPKSSVRVIRQPALVRPHLTTQGFTTRSIMGHLVCFTARTTGCTAWCGRRHVTLRDDVDQSPRQQRGGPRAHLHSGPSSARQTTLVRESAVWVFGLELFPQPRLERCLRDAWRCWKVARERVHWST